MTPKDIAATNALIRRLDALLEGHHLDVVELALVSVVVKLALAGGDHHDCVGAFFERVHFVLLQWDEDIETNQLLTMPTQGPMQ